MILDSHLHPALDELIELGRKRRWLAYEELNNTLPDELVNTDRIESVLTVIDDEGKYRGLFGLNDFREFLNDATLAEIAVAHDLTSRCPPLLLQMDLSEAMARFAASRFDELPVVDEQDPDQILGMLRRADLIATYSARLMQMRDGDSEAATPPEAGAAMDAEPGTQGRHA